MDCIWGNLIIEHLRLKEAEKFLHNNVKDFLSQILHQHIFMIDKIPNI